MENTSSLVSEIKNSEPTPDVEKKRLRLEHSAEEPADAVVVTAKKKQTVLDDSLQTAVTPCSHCNSHGPQLGMPSRRLSQEEVDSLLWKEASYSKSLSESGGGVSSTTTTKRTDYISWDDYFLSVASLSAKRSKDTKTPTGACLVDARNRIVGIGYNGFPRNCSDNLLPWTSDNNANGGIHSSATALESHLFVVHAEVNAILNKCSADVAGCRLYCQSFPCHECAKVIVQSRIAQVIYCDNGVHDAQETDSMRASRIMLQMAGVEVIRIQPKQAVIELRLADNLSSKDAAPKDGNMSPTDIQGSTPGSILEAAEGNEPLESLHRQILVREANYDPLLHTSSKRSEGVLSWDDYFTSMAFLTAQRSKDPNTQVGACIVDSQKRIIGLGYNGFPSGCSDDDLPWARQASNELHRKYLYVCHAEVNAILNKGSADVRGATLYVALFPCNECAKLIVQAGIQEVVYIHDFYHDTDQCRASRIMFQMAGVKLRKHTPTIETIRLELASK
jgi:dCMP deaminase